MRETNLEKSLTSKLNRARLQAGWWLLSGFLLQIGLTADRAFDDCEVANQVLADFVNYAKSTGVKLWRVRYAVLSVQYRFKHLKRRLPRPWEAIHSWQLTQPVHTRLPIDKGILKAIFAAERRRLASSLKSDPLNLILLGSFPVSPPQNIQDTKYAPCAAGWLPSFL